MSGTYLRVALDHPLATLFDYRCDAQPAPARHARAGAVRQAAGRQPVCEVTTHTDVPPSRLRAIDAICTDLPPLSPDWLALVSFAADYYQRGRGEVALPALPQALRDAGRWGGCSRLRCVTGRRKRAARRCLMHCLRAAPRCVGSRRRWSTAARWRCRGARAAPEGGGHARRLAARGWVDVEEIGWADAPVPKAVDNLLAAGGRTVPPALTDQQAEALDAIRAAQGFAPFLLHGVTGSGKTEVYLHALASLLDARPEAQALVLVPEINLTPQFEAAFRARFAGRSPTMRSSRCTARRGERARNWLAAHTGRARIVLGTRLAVLASMPTLALIVVDEEHGSRTSSRKGCAIRRAILPYGGRSSSASRSCSARRRRRSKAGGRPSRAVTRGSPSRRAVADATLPTVRLIDLEEGARRGRASMGGLSAARRGAEGAARARRTEPRVPEPAVMRRSSRAMPAAGSPAARAAARMSCCTSPSTRCAAITAAGNRAFRGRAPSAGVVTSRRSGAARNASRRRSPRPCPARACCGSTRQHAPQGQRTGALSDVHAGEVDILVGTQMIAKGTTSSAYRSSACSMPIPRCSRTTSARANGCSHS